MASVLVVDDDPNSRLLVRTVLSYAGHEVFEAADGAQALAAAKSDAPQLILLDLSLPGMSGAEFLRALRADPATKATVVALYTASAMNPALADFMSIYGVAGAVPKPSEPAELIAAVERLMKKD